MFFFDMAEGDKTSVPLDQVMQLMKQGLSDDAIVQELTKQGYNSNAVFDAISQAQLKGTIESPPIANIPPPPGSPPAPQRRESMEVERIEEIAEAIIDEKWDELVSNVTRIIDWKDEVERNIAAMQERLTQIDEKFKHVHASMIGKIGDYDQTMKDVGTDVKALTKVFQKILPGFMENVNELSRIAEQLGGKKSSKKKIELEETSPKKKSRMEEIFEAEK